MFKGESVGEDARRIAEAARFNEADLQFISQHCVIRPGEPDEAETRNCCLRGDCKIYVGIIGIIGIFGLLIWYYLF